jgi:aspartate aminotransferase-like enzyme
MVTDCFRIGNIGRLFENDMTTLAQCIEQVCKEMSIALPLTSAPQA